MYKYLPALFIWIFLFSFESLSSSFSDDELGNRIAIGFSGNSYQNITQENLDRAFSMGINLVEISDYGSVNHLSFNEFNIFYRHRLFYPTVQKLRDNRTDIVREIESAYRELYQRYPGQIFAISPFSFPPENDLRFYSEAFELADTLGRNIDASFYYHSSLSSPDILPDSFNFVMGFASPSTILRENAQVMLFEPTGNKHESFQLLEQLLNRSVEYPSSIIVIPSDWFFEQMEKSSDLMLVFISHMQGQSVNIPMPDPGESIPSVNWGVILLVVIWISFILHYKNQPVYSGILTRYFTSHSFFVNDVMEHRFRNSAPGLIILIQHSLLTGLAFYATASVFFSKLGLEALSIHFPGLFISGYELLSLFVLGVLTALLAHLIAVFWIYILNKQLTHISQVLNLYSWPLHINLLLVTLLIFFKQMGALEIWILATAVSIVFTCFMSFNMAAVDSARFLEKFRVMNLFFTIGLHLLIITALLIFFFYSPIIIEPLRLALFLP